MGHMRISSDVIRSRGQERGGKTWHPRRYRDIEYLFTMSPYEAAHYISPDNTITDGDYVDPNQLFPRYVMRGVDYAIKQHGKCFVAAQIRASDGAQVGVIMTLTLGDLIIGIYAIRSEAPNHYLDPRVKED